VRCCGYKPFNVIVILCDMQFYPRIPCAGILLLPAWLGFQVPQHFLSFKPYFKGEFFPELAE
jgi:hypothetical protein